MAQYAVYPGDGVELMRRSLDHDHHEHHDHHGSDDDEHTFQKRQQQLQQQHDDLNGLMKHFFSKRQIAFDPSMEYE